MQDLARVPQGENDPDGRQGTRSDSGQHFAVVGATREEEARNEVEQEIAQNCDARTADNRQIGDHHLILTLARLAFLSRIRHRISGLEH